MLSGGELLDKMRCFRSDGSEKTQLEQWRLLVNGGDPIFRQSVDRSNIEIPRYKISQPALQS